MHKFFLVLFITCLCRHNEIFAQHSPDKTVYIVDSITVIDDPAEGDDISTNNVADFTVIKNRDTLDLLGFKEFDNAVYLFTKQYRGRPEALKKIPSTRQMEKKDDRWCWHGVPYTGKFIDYYYSGDKQGEGTFVNGHLDGNHKMYYKNGKPYVERAYTDGIANGTEKEYYEDGSLKQKGVFINGKEDGVWEIYFPNGQLKQKSTFVAGVVDGETIMYYSTGKLFAVEVSSNGKTTPDKRFDKIDKLIKKAHERYKDSDYKSDIAFCSKAIALDSDYADAYFSRGTLELNQQMFDDAIEDFDHALTIEPYMDVALANRAFARINKYEFSGGRKLIDNSNVTILAGNGLPIPPNEQEKICADLQKAMFLGDKRKMITEAASKYCK